MGGIFLYGWWESYVTASHGVFAHIFLSKILVFQNPGGYCLRNPSEHTLF